MQSDWVRMIHMTDDPTDTQLSKLLQHAGHELRNPLGAVSGYIRMLLKEQAGPISDAQKRLLTEAQRSSGRLTDLLDEISHLAKIERGEEPLKRGSIALGRVIDEAIGSLPEQPDRTVPVNMRATEEITLQGDPARLKRAVRSVLFALRREVITSGPLTVLLSTASGEAVIAIGDSEDVEALGQMTTESLAPFMEFRGGCGLSLPIARRIIEQHRGRLYGAGPESKASAVIRLPLT